MHGDGACSHGTGRKHNNIATRDEAKIEPSRAKSGCGGTYHARHNTPKASISWVGVPEALLVGVGRLYDDW
jgi:hypothetical protein